MGIKVIHQAVRILHPSSSSTATAIYESFGSVPNHLLLLLTSSSTPRRQHCYPPSTTSSTPASRLHRHLLTCHIFAPATVMKTSSNSPSDNDVSECALSLVRTVLATPHPDAFTEPGKPDKCLAMASLTVSSTSIDLLPRRLPQRVSVFIYDAFSFAPPSFGTPSCACGFICAYLNFGILDYYADHGYPMTGIFS